MLPEERKIAEDIITVLNTGKKFEWLNYYEQYKGNPTAYENATFRLQKQKIIRKDHSFGYLQGELFEYGKTYEQMIDPNRADRILPLHKKNWFENTKGVITLFASVFGIIGVCSAIYFGSLQAKNNQTIKDLNNRIDTLRMENEGINARYLQYKDQYETLRKQSLDTLKK